ncbi:hypothetical protein LTR66_005098 [Elasticomyces elasticus]|nr:hypothetical protein LTR66_005098 [Elasticomyces elasticus]
MAAKLPRYAATVVGAGPAGITAVGNLLARDLKPILWVDRHFAGGRVNQKYRQVPSNTKVSLFRDFAEAVQPFRDVVRAASEGGQSNAFTRLGALRQDQGCELGYAADMTLMLTEGLVKSPGVETRRGSCEAAEQDHTDDWTVEIASPSDGEEAKAISPLLVLCTGSSPISSPLPYKEESLKPLDLDLALDPTQLAATIDSTKKTTVGVIGASHSAILALLNLANLAKSSHPSLDIKWFTRHPLRFAEYRDGWILRDNTGLKGQAADWARENLADAKFLDGDTPADSKLRRYIEKITIARKEDEEAVYGEHLPRCDYIVQAVGFKRDPLPRLTRNGEVLRPRYDHETAGFTDESGGGGGERIKGLYGAGIAFPERVTDPEGNVEYAVGFWKFMKYVKRVSPMWA